MVIKLTKISDAYLEPRQKSVMEFFLSEIDRKTLLEKQFQAFQGTKILNCERKKFGINF